MLLIGEINGIFGVKGWVKLFSFTQKKANICQYKPWLMQVSGLYQPMDIIDCKPQGKTIIAKIKGIDDCDQARLYLGKKLYLHPDKLPKSGKGEYYWSELIGMTVLNTGNIELGVVSDLFNSGANDILVVKKDKTQQLIPYSENHIIKINTQEKTIIVDWEEYY